VCAASMTGAWAETAVVEANDVHVIPDNMLFETAAAFPVVYGTSHLGLEARGNLQPGETLLVLGAGGGVGLTAVEIGKRMGATVIAVAGSDERLSAASTQGADHLIDHRSEDIRDRAKELTGGRGVDVVYDPVGGSAFDGAFRATARNARIVIVGFASGEVPQIPANIVLVKNLTVHGYVWGAYREYDPEIMRASMATLLGWYEDGSLTPHPPTVMALADAKDAVSALVERRVTGKIVLRIE
ncbi:MAG: NADPH:quinone oxidoreductase family protein, partial [Proteobacteria bacterium]|nr:NADPH:quinone oxidoreductase family protein [Pseudomonadota bacterium]